MKKKNPTGYKNIHIIDFNYVKEKKLCLEKRLDEGSVNIKVALGL